MLKAGGQPIFFTLSLAWETAARWLGGNRVCRAFTRDDAKALPVDAPGGTSNSCRINEPSGHGARAASFFGLQQKDAKDTKDQGGLEQKEAKEAKDLTAFGLVLFALFLVAVFSGFRPR